jgi:hypothetical protein
MKRCFGKGKETMALSQAITTLFVDVGNVLLTDSWGRLCVRKP